MHSVSHYERIKILNEDGKKYANVELSYVSTSGDFYADGVGNDKSLEDIHGRTIHPDGTVIPFTGKPYLKVMEKGKGVKYQAKVFTLPDVTVGSIIEYSYATRINDHVYEAPTWIIQGDLYVRSAHYMWWPTSHDLQSPHGEIHTISWFPILPKGAEIVHHEIPGVGANGLAQYTYELTVKDIPPFVEEEYMPPIQNYGFRVHWNFIAEHDADDYWKTEGKDWSKAINSFANPNSDLRAATQKITAGATTQEQKLRAIYAAVQKFENTDYTRQHEAREDKANGLGKLNNADDVFKRQRGNSTQLTELFIAMARAAGMQADAMLVPDRSREIFLTQWLNMDQFDDLIAVVNVDGKDQFFDPGERYCPYSHLAWQHEFLQGLRQKGNETAFSDVSGDGFKYNTVDRIANLKMDATGLITGRIDLNYAGPAALRWRHTALRGDDESLKHELRSSLEAMIPHTLEVKDVTVSNVADYESPLKVTYTVEGTVGSWTGKRLVVPADLFLVNHKATFPHEKREIAVDFNYPQWTRDALRINFPSTFSIEAAPPAAKYGFKQMAAYEMTIESAPTNFTTRRNYVFGDIYVLPPEYPQLRSFYSQLETNDQQSIVLKSASAGATATASATPAVN
jgi:transglutaminase-like putative cysteine protease